MAKDETTMCHLVDGADVRDLIAEQNAIIDLSLQIESKARKEIRRLHGCLFCVKCSEKATT